VKKKSSSIHIHSSMTKQCLEIDDQCEKLVKWVYNPNSRSSSSFNSWDSFCIFSSCNKI